MSEDSDFSSVRIRARKYTNLKTYIDASFVSNEQTKNVNKNQSIPHKIDFQQYLYTQHQSPSQKSDESLEYHQNESEESQQNRISNAQKNPKTNKILIEMGQNYTFADQMSSNRKSNKYLKNIGFFPSLKKKILSMHHPLSHRNIKKESAQNQSYLEDSSQIVQESNVQSKSSQSNDIGLSDDQQNFGVAYYKAKQIEEELFLKVSQQAKLILQLEQKVYYFQDFSKRLLKSQQQSSKINQYLARQLKTTKKLLKAKDRNVKQLQQHLKNKDKKLTEISSQNQILQNERINIKKNSNQAKKVLGQRQNEQNLMMIQHQRTIFEKKFKDLTISFQKMSRKLTETQKQLQKLKVLQQTLTKKSKKLQSMNKILQKQISELNIKIFQLQTQMQNTTCNKYAKNLIRIKSFTTTQGFKDPLSTKSPLITQPFEAVSSIRLSRL